MYLFVYVLDFHQTIIFFFHFNFSLQDIFSGTTHLSDSSTLILDRVDRHHAGVYQCAADNGVREPVSMDIHLTILCKYFISNIPLYYTHNRKLVSDCKSKNKSNIFVHENR